RYSGFSIGRANQRHDGTRMVCEENWRSIFLIPGIMGPLFHLNTMPLLSREFIQSFDSPDLVPYRTMKQQRDTRLQRVFVAEGDKVVQRLLASAVSVISVLLPVKRESEILPMIESRPEPIRLFVAELSTLEQLTGFSLYQGVLAVGRVPDSCGMDE